MKPYTTREQKKKTPNNSNIYDKTLETTASNSKLWCKTNPNILVHIRQPTPTHSVSNHNKSCAVKHQ